MNLKNRFVTYFVLISVTLFLISGLVQPAGAEEPIRLEVFPGFGGDYKWSQFVPVRVKVTNNGPDFEGTLLIENKNGGPSTATFVQPVALARGATKTYTLGVPGQGLNPGTVVRLEAKDGSLVADQKVGGHNLGPEGLLIGVLAGRADTAGFLGNMPKGKVRGITRVQQLSTNDITENPNLLKSLDVLVLNNFPVDTLSPLQVKAIQTWVEDGGMLILGGGASYQKTAAPWLALSPVKSGALERWSQFASLNQKAGKDYPLTGAMNITAGVLERGRALLEDKGRPIIAVNDVGKGQVMFCAYDLAEEPLAAWSGNSELWGNFLSVYFKPNQMPVKGRMGLDGWYPLVNAAERIPALKAPPIEVLAGLFVLYILVVGPVLYFVMRRLDKREWNWLAIPAISIAFAAGLFLYGAKDRASGAMTHNLSIIEIQGKQANITTGVAMFVPEGGTYQVQTGEGQVAWPFANYYRGTPDEMARQVRVSLGENNTQLEFRNVEFWSLRKAVIQRTLSNIGGIEAHLVYRDGGLEGTIANHTPYAIYDAKILQGVQVTDIGQLPPGKEIAVKAQYDSSWATLTMNPKFGPGGPIPLQQLVPATSTTAAQVSTGGVSSIPMAAPQPVRVPMGPPSREMEMLQTFYQGGPMQLNGGVTLFGWTEDSIADYTIKGHAQTAFNLGLIRVPIEILPNEKGEVLYGAGYFQPTLVDKPNNVGIGPDGFHFEVGEIVLDYALREKEPTFTPTKIQLHLWSYDNSISFKKAVYNWEKKTFEDWDTVSKDNGLSSENIKPFLSPDGHFRLRVSHDMDGPRHLGTPALTVEGKVKP